MGDGALQSKQRRLEETLLALGRTLIAYSGGADSAYLAWTAYEVLGDDMLAVIADSPSLARFQLEDALAFARENGIPHEMIQTAELERAEYTQNDRSRCFHCKDELFTEMHKFAESRDFQSIAYGINVDDQGDFRPGQAAAIRHHIATPLLTAGLTKADVRQLAREAGLRIWDKPASACLSSRIEYGLPVTPESLGAVERGEDALRGLGFRQVRVRHHGDIARIEIAAEDMQRALNLEMFKEFARIFKALGYAFVTLDVEGFRSGSMNAATPRPLLKILP